MDGPIFFNSLSSNQRGLVVLLKDSFPAKNKKIENIICCDYTWLSFVVHNTKISIKYCYVPNEDMTCIASGSENYSNKFSKTIFDDLLDSNYDVSIMVGDFDVALDHNKDTLGYLHINNPNTRRFIDRMNMMTDIFRHKHPDLR